MKLPLGSVCWLPCVAVSSFRGCAAAEISDAVLRVWSSRIASARENLRTGGKAELSNTVIAPSARRWMSCCHANRAARASLERAPLAAEPPEDPARLAIDLVPGPGVARGHQEVAVGLEVDRVGVRVVERGLRPRLGERLGERDLAERVPLERHQPGRDVDLLDHRVDDEAALGPLHRPQVLAHDRIADDHGLVVRRDLELVQVGPEAVGAADAADGAGRTGRGSPSRRRRCPAARCRASR